MKKTLLLFCLSGLFLFQSCSSSNIIEQRYSDLEKKLENGRVSDALSTFKKKKSEYSSNDKVLFYLDEGILNFYNANYDAAIKAFSKAEKRIEDNYTRSVTAGISSFLTNDYALVYPGDEFEDVYLNIFKALSFIHLNNHEAAFVEIRKMNEKFKLFAIRYQEEIEKLNTQDEKKSLKVGEYNYTDSALGRYLSYLLYRSDEQYDDALIDLRKISILQNRYNNLYSEKTDLNAFSKKLPNDSSLINLVSFVGQGAYKYPWELTAVSIADHLLVEGRNPDYSANFWVGKSGLNFRLAIPKLRERESRINKVNVFVNGELKESLEEIESFSKAAVNNFKLEEDAIVFKSVMRSIAKTAATSYVNDKVGDYIFEDDDEDDDDDDKKSKNSDTGSKVLAGIFALAFNFAVLSSEQADLRTWRLLPNKALTAEIKVPNGKHKVEIVYYDRYNKILKRDVKTVSVSKNKTLNLVTSYAF